MMEIILRDYSNAQCSYDYWVVGKRINKDNDTKPLSAEERGWVIEELEKQGLIGKFEFETNPKRAYAIVGNAKIRAVSEPKNES